MHSLKYIERKLHYEDETIFRKTDEYNNEFHESQHENC